MNFLGIILAVGLLGLLVYEVYKLVDFVKTRKKKKQEEQAVDSSSPDDSQKN